MDASVNLMEMVYQKSHRKAKKIPGFGRPQLGKKVSKPSKAAAGGRRN